MSIAIYKELNKELVDKVQELKKANAFLEKELATVNAQYFEGHQLLTEERQMFSSILSQLKNNIHEAEFLINGEEPGVERRVSVTLSAREKNRHSSGVWQKSPIRSRNSEHCVIEEQDKESNRTLNAWGLNIIEEASYQKTVSALGQLSINEEQAEYVPSIEVENSDKSKANIENAIGVPRCSGDLIREDGVYNCSNSLTPTFNFGNLSSSTHKDSSLKDLYITPADLEANATTDISATLTDSNINNTSNSTTGRTRRNCAPISLMEPKLGTKLRSDGGTKKPRKGKKSR